MAKDTRSLANVRFIAYNTNPNNNNNNNNNNNSKVWGLQWGQGGSTATFYCKAVPHQHEKAQTP